jgi:hypothetical protein
VFASLVYLTLLRDATYPFLAALFSLLPFTIIYLSTTFPSLGPLIGELWIFCATALNFLLLGVFRSIVSCCDRPKRFSMSFGALNSILAYGGSIRVSLKISGLAIGYSAFNALSISSSMFSP